MKPSVRTMRSGGRSSSCATLELSVVVPVYNGAAFIIPNLTTIRQALDESEVSYELIVVSDGSIDATAGELAAAQRPARVIHYEQNMGKGYAVKVGMLAATGDYVAFIDADLDLHPGELISFLEIARSQRADAVIGSKRHPASIVDYPTRRRFYSWSYQQLIRLLFGVDVRDTQVGIKLFTRELVDAVIPVILVKRYAFDLELLVVAHRLGFDHVVEAPVRLDYQFSGSGINKRAVAQALWDTAAIWYRLHIRRSYSNAAAEAPRYGGDVDDPKRLGIILVGVGNRSATRDALARMDAPPRIIESDSDEPVFEWAHARRLQLLKGMDEPFVAYVPAGAIPSTNWESTLLRSISAPDVVAVTGPCVPRFGNTIREQASSALFESRVAAGPVRRRHDPGVARDADLGSHASMVVRREIAILVETSLLADHTAHEGEYVQQLRRFGRVQYSPDAHMTVSIPPLFRPLLTRLRSHGRSRGMRLRSARSMPRFLILPIAAILVFLALVPTLYVSHNLAIGYALMTLLVIYAGAIAISTLHCMLRRPIPAALLFGVAVPAAHAAYLLGFASGLLASQENH